MSDKRAKDPHAGGGRGGGKFEHTQELAEALDKFQEALGDRYLQVMYDRLGWGLSSIPGPAHLEGQLPEMWNDTTQAAQAHLSEGNCSFKRWYHEREPGETPESITCQSSIQGGPFSDGSDDGFTCGVGQVFAQAFQWAWSDRNWIYNRIPLFASQDIDQLKLARDAFANAANVFGGYEGGGWDVDGSFSLDDGSGDLRNSVAQVSLDDEASSEDWMVGWTGAAAEAAAKGFFHTTKPTLSNHALIADAIGYLINLRATIIDRNRVNTLTLIETATGALKETEDVVLTGRWRVVQGIGMTLALAAPVVPVGAGLTLVGWLGENLYPVKKDAAFASEPHEVAGQLAESFDQMGKEIATSEADYREESAAVEDAIGSIALEYLELYDITQNDPEGTAGKDGSFSVDINVLTGLATLCYAIAESYEEVRSQLGDIYAGDSHLTDQDGDATAADRRIMTMREDFTRFITTTLGRWSLMGEQIEDAARRYAEEDDAAARTFELWDESTESQGEGPPIATGKAEEVADSTDRNSTAPQEESSEDEFEYDSEGWRNDASDPEKQ